MRRANGINCFDRTDWTRAGRGALVNEFGPDQTFYFLEFFLEFLEFLVWKILEFFLEFFFEAEKF